MARFLLLRHAESACNACRRMQGWADPPLSDRGQAGARRLGRALARAGGTPLVAAVSSDLVRARQTAQALLEGAEGTAPVQLDARLRERDVGWITGMDEATASARFPEEMADWRARRVDRPPGGERESSVLLRARRALDDLARQASAPDDSLTVVISHGGVISILERAAELGAGGFANLHGRWLQVEEGRGWRLGERFAAESVRDG